VEYDVADEVAAEPGGFGGPGGGGSRGGRRGDTAHQVLPQLMDGYLRRQDLLIEDDAHRTWLALRQGCG
jgi:hypothetical protein